MTKRKRWCIKIIFLISSNLSIVQYDVTQTIHNFLIQVNEQYANDLVDL